MTRGARAALFFGAFAAAAFLGAGSRIALARAEGPPQPTDLTAGITDYANSEVDAAMAESATVVSQVVQIDRPMASPTPTAGVQTPSAPAEATPPPSASTDDTVPAVGVGSVEVLAAPEPILPPPLAGALDSSPEAGALDSSRAGTVARHDLEQLAQKLKGNGHRSRSIVDSSTSLRVELRASETTTGGETSSSSAYTVARSTVRTAVKSSASGGRSQGPANPKAPLPSPPYPPSAPAPNSGGWSPGGGGQGALLIFFVALAALVIFGIHRLLRKVHWSGLRMPRRSVVLPWRPG